MEFNYCPLCAAALIKPVEGFPHCPKGHFTQYPSVLTGVAALVLMDGNLLLEQRAIEPGYGRWGIPGGMMESGEEPEEACIREIFEETGFKIAIKKLITAKSAKTVCALVYEVEVIGGTLKMSDESLDVRWFPLKNIPWDEMAFESHSSVLKNWLRNRGNDE